MLINLSNHPSQGWSERQLEAASHYGEIIDIAFPPISPSDNYEQIEQLAEKYLDIIANNFEQSKTKNAVHIAGELSFCYALITKLKKLGCTTLTSTSRRITENIDDKTTIKRFEFEQFREF